MKKVLRRMREQPDLSQLKRQAKELMRAFAAGDAAAVAEVNAHYRGADPAAFPLHQAQLVLARSYGFPSWAKLKAYVDGVTVRRLAAVVQAGDLPEARSLLKARPELANLTLSYGDEHRPLHFAVMNRSVEMVRLLMRHGASARAGIHPHRDATSAWTLAQERGFVEIVAAIEEEESRPRTASEPEPSHEPAPPPRHSSEEAARAAVAAGNLEWLAAQCAAGTLTNPIRWRDGGLLTVAVEHDQFEALRLLLDCGFDPDERVSSGEGDWLAQSQGYPLWQCAALGRRAMAELLLERGASPNVHVDSSGSAVYSAYSHRQWEMVDILRRHGGIVTADIAAIYRQTDLARQLLAADATVAEDLLNFGASGGDPEIVRMALDHLTVPLDDPRWFRWLTEPLTFWHHIPWLYAGNPDFDRQTYIACFRLILARCGPHCVGAFGRTALHEVAAMRDYITEEEAEPFARALLDAGAAVSARDTILRSTPLGWACRWGRASVVRLLLERGADPIEADAEPWATPRAWATKREHKDILVLLGEAGAG